MINMPIIKRGFQDQTFGMPFPALAANLSWEFIFAFLLPHGRPQVYINIVWFTFDVVILYQALRFGKSVVKDLLPDNLFYPTFLLTLLVAFGAVLSITYEFQDWQGKYAAFRQNLMMSILFVTMLLRRNSISGQSIYIAVFKIVGTLLPSIAFFTFYSSSPLLNFLYVTIFVFDWIYIRLLYLKYRELGVNVWTRW
jgi:hypothetical protein